MSDNYVSLYFFTRQYSASVVFNQRYGFMSILVSIAALQLKGT